MLLKVEDNPLLPREFNALVDQLFTILGKICYRLNRTPEHGTVTVDLSGIAENTVGEVEVDVAGLQVGDKVIAHCNGPISSDMRHLATFVKTIHKLCVRAYHQHVPGAPHDHDAETWVWLKLD